MKNVNIFTKTLKILFFTFLMFMIFTIPAQACRTGVCYTNGIAGTPSASCGGSCPSNPCWWTDINSYCRGHNPINDITESTTANCTTTGTTSKYVRCTHCSQRHFHSSSTTNPLGHQWPSTYSHDEDSHWKKCIRSTNGCGGQYLSADSPHNWSGSDNWT